MKKILIGLAAVAALAAVITLTTGAAGDPSSLGATSPRYGYTTMCSGITNALSTATNVNVTIDCRFQKDVALSIELYNDAAGACTMGIPWQRSVDGTHWEALNSLLISFNGVTVQTVVTNLPTYGAGYIKIPYVTNANGTINTTNLALRAAQKVLAP
jgi:hypothetical protein